MVMKQHFQALELTSKLFHRQESKHIPALALCVQVILAFSHYKLDCKLTSICSTQIGYRLFHFHHPQVCLLLIDLCHLVVRNFDPFLSCQKEQLMKKRQTQFLKVSFECLWALLRMESLSQEEGKQKMGQEQQKTHDVHPPLFHSLDRPQLEVIDETVLQGKPVAVQKIKLNM